MRVVSSHDLQIFSILFSQTFFSLCFVQYLNNNLNL
jgi:hypothetical protein